MGARGPTREGLCCLVSSWALRCPWEGAAGKFQGGAAFSNPPGPQVTLLLSLDPQLYQEIQERGLNTSQESDDDILDESSSPEGAQKMDTTIVVKSYRPAQITWSQLPEVAPEGG